MENTKALLQVVDNPAIDQIAEPLSKAVRGAYEAAGPVGQPSLKARNHVTASIEFPPFRIPDE